MDIIAAVQAVKYARKWVVGGNGPILMEFVTYRYGGHSYVEKGSVSVNSLILCTECPTREPPTALVKRSKGCGVRRILLEVSSVISRTGALQPSRNLRFV